MTIDEARGHIGHAVAYRSGTDEAEEGVITSVGGVFAFVAYGGARYSQVTRPEDLTLLAGEVPDG
jgi:hypothetical protein